MATPDNPIEVQSYLDGIDYPVRREDLVRHAEERGAPEDVLTALRRVRDEKFDDPTDVSEAIGRLNR